MSTKNIIPIVSLWFKNDNGNRIPIIKNFSNVGEIAHCESPFEINKYFDNLMRLGLIESSPIFMSMTNKEQYKPLKEHKFFDTIPLNMMLESMKYKEKVFEEGYMRLTSYGISFCSICITSN